MALFRRSYKEPGSGLNFVVERAEAVSASGNEPIT
jgi:hypothetical protein